MCARILFLILLLCVFNCLASAACPDNCGLHGSCNTNAGYCVCDYGWLSSNCSTQAGKTGIFGVGSNVFTIEWAIINSGSTLLVRHTFNNIDWWWGGIFNVDPDGMSPDNSVTGAGDTWIMWIDSTNGPIISDRYSSGRNQPQVDSQQDLILVGGYQNTTHQVIEHTRLLKTSDTQDVQFDINSSYRYMWTTGGTKGAKGDGGHGKSSSTSGSVSSDVNMHKYIGYCGQIRVNFVNFEFEELSDGVKWPPLYWALLVSFVGACILAGLFRMNYLKITKLGSTLQRPLINPTHSCIDNSCDRLMFNFISSFFNLTINEYILLGIYIAFLVVGISISINDYNTVGRSPTYMIGQLSAIHLALLLLPVTKNSFFLRFIFNTPYAIAIIWHRRLGRITILLVLIHAICMIIFWDISQLFTLSASQYGLAPLYGTLALVSLLILFFTSLERVRRNHYNFFIHSHIILAIMGYVFGLMHSLQLRWLLLGPGILFIIDVFLRIYNVLNNKSTIKSIQLHHNLVTLTIHSPKIISQFKRPIPNSININYRYGSYIYINILSLSLLQFHPFSIASIDHEENLFTLTIHCSNDNDDSNNNWTSKLLKLAKQFNAQTFIGPIASEQYLKKFNLLIDGVYYSNDIPLYKSSVLIFVAGGVGITPIINTLHHLIQANHHENVKDIHVILSAKNTHVLMDQLFEKQFQLLLQCGKVHLYLYQTSSSLAEPPAVARPMDRELVEIRVNHEHRAAVNMSAAEPVIHYGRPDLDSIFDHINSSVTPEDRVLVSCCGPPPLILSAQSAAHKSSFNFTTEHFAL